MVDRYIDIRGNTQYGGFSVAVTPNGQRVFVGNDMDITAFSQAGSFLWNSRSTVTEYPYLLVSPDGAYLFAAGFKTFRAFTLTGSSMWTFDPHHPSPGVVASWWLPRISADGNVIAAVSLDGYVKVLNRSGKLLWDMAVPAGALPPSLGVSGNGSMIVVGSENEVYAYALTGSLLWSYGPFQDSILFLSMSDDARTIIVKTARQDIFSLDYDGSLRWHKLPYDPNHWFMITSADFWYEIVEVTHDGSRIFTTKIVLENGNNAFKFSCFDSEGTELWTSSADGFEAIMLRSSSNGGTFAASGDAGALVLNRSGGELALYPFLEFPGAFRSQAMGKRLRQLE